MIHIDYRIEEALVIKGCDYILRPFILPIINLFMMLLKELLYN